MSRPGSSRRCLSGLLAAGVQRQRLTDRDHQTSHVLCREHLPGRGGGMVSAGGRGRGGGIVQCSIITFQIGVGMKIL